MLIISKKKVTLSHFVPHKYIDVLVNINIIVLDLPSKIKHCTNEAHK